MVQTDGWAYGHVITNFSQMGRLPHYLIKVHRCRGAYIWRGDLTEDFLRYPFVGLIFGGAYTWRGLFSEFYGTLDNTDIETISAFRFRLY